MIIDCAHYQDGRRTGESAARLAPREASRGTGGGGLRGGLDAGRAAQCHLAGGHSIDDPEPKYGMAVTGTADRAPCCASTPHCRLAYSAMTRPGLAPIAFAQACRRAQCPREI